MLLAKMFVQVPYFCLLPRCLCGNSRCVRLCALETHMDISQKKKCKVIRIMLQPRNGAPVSCKFSQSKCTSTFHKTFLRGNFQGTRTRRLGTSFCASLGSRNADRHVTRIILHGHLQGKGRTPRPRTSLFEQGIFYDPPSISIAEEVPRRHWALLSAG